MPPVASDAFVPLGGMLDQAFLAKVMQHHQELAEEFAMETGDPVELVDDADVMEFRSEQIEDDKLRIGIVTCDAYSVSQDPPPTNLFDPLFNERVVLPTIPLTTIQSVMDRFVVSIITASRLSEQLPFNVLYEGDGRWLYADTPAPPPPEPEIDYEKSVELDGELYRVWKVTREILESMYWQYTSTGMMRAKPSSLFWKAWHADKDSMKKIGFRAYKKSGVWSVFVTDLSLINLLRNLPR